MDILRAPRHRAMARHRAQRAIADRQRKLRVLCLIVLIAGIVALMQHPSAIPREKNTSILQGQDWIDELLAGHPTRFYSAMGMRKQVFRRLLCASQVCITRNMCRWRSNWQYFCIHAAQHHQQECLRSAFREVQTQSQGMFHLRNIVPLHDSLSESFTGSST
jgi:hypothetical protein